ncbi:hypothetical protein D5b_00469 [Faustovirus]|nr:hypothetical protein D5b_00469 [Faustovirus]
MMSVDYLKANGISQPATKYAPNESICDILKLQLVERLFTKTDRIGYVDGGAELIPGDQLYTTTTPFWIISDGIANLVKFDSVYVSNTLEMTQSLNNILNKATPLWMYLERLIISNGKFYAYKWVFNKTKGVLMIELTNGEVCYFRSTLEELFTSTDMEQYDDRHLILDVDITLEKGDELYIYREFGVLILIFTVVRDHKPMRPLDYVNAAFTPRPESICLFNDVAKK